MTKPYSIKISILYSIKNKVSQFFWIKKILTRELMKERDVFTFLASFTGFCFHFRLIYEVFLNFFASLLNRPKINIPGVVSL